MIHISLFSLWIIPSCLSACPGDNDVFTGDGPLPMAIFELLEYIVNEVTEVHCMMALLKCLYICMCLSWTVCNCLYHMYGYMNICISSTYMYL